MQKEVQKSARMDDSQEGAPARVKGRLRSSAEAAVAVAIQGDAVMVRSREVQMEVDLAF